MASRPVFYVDSNQTNIKEQAIDFKWHSGFAKSQKQKSIYEFHQAVDEKLGIDNILEVSSKSQSQIGVALSAFNLTIPVKGNLIPLENIFQASKVFEKGGPFKDLLGVLPHEAKRDLRLKESGNLIYFQGRDLKWELTPVTIYYDWLYLNALKLNVDLSRKVMDFSAFTDIEFNPKKSINCQARSVAMFVSMNQNGDFKEAMSSSKRFKSIYPLYEANHISINHIQKSLF